MHIDNTQVELLAEKFFEKYNRVLIGKNLGQFHVDFDCEGADNDDINAIKSIFLGKKCYYDLLMCENTDGSKVYDEHIRMKGVPIDAIKHRAKVGIYEQNIVLVDNDNNFIKSYVNIEDWKESPDYKNENKLYDYFTKDGKKIKDFNNDVYELYLYLYQGNEVSFDLLATKPKFEFHKNMTISSKTEFNRKLSFPDKEIIGFDNISV